MNSNDDDAHHIFVAEGGGSSPPQIFSSVIEILDQWAAKTPEADAIILDDCSLSYRDLQKAAHNIARSFLERGVARGSRIAYVGRNSSDQIALFFACAKAGLRLVLPNWRLSAREMALLLKDAGPTVTFYQQEFAHLFEANGCGHNSNIQLSARSNDLSNALSSRLTKLAPAESDPSDDLVICYTSGSTGQPKGVRQTQANWLAVVAQMQIWPGGKWRIGSNSLCVLPFFHVAGLRAAVIPLAFGGTAFVPVEMTAEAIFEIIRQRPIDKLSAVPTVLKILLEQEGVNDLHGRLQTVLYGGASIPAALIEQGRTVYDCDFVQTYGASETTGTAIALDDADHDEAALRLGRCGRPLPGMEVGIVRPDGLRADVGEVGEIRLRGSTVSPGYWNRPDETEASFSNGWFKPGDLGRLDESGFLYFCGRNSDVIRTGGEKVYPREIEQVLIEHPVVLDVFACGVPDAKWGEAVVTAVVLKSGCDIGPSDLIQFCRARLAAFKCPRRMKIFSTIPRNSGGKPDKKTILSEFSDGVTQKIAVEK